MKYYHATSEDSLSKILAEGVIKTGFDGIVYLAETQENALRFVALRLLDQPVIVLEIDIPDESKLIETFDHSYKFFKCKSFGYLENISSNHITAIWKYS